MSTVINQPYSTSGNGGRKLVRLSNGWEVAGTKTTDYFYFYVDKKNGNGFVPLCHIYDIAINDNDIAIVSKGTMVYATPGHLNAQVHSYYFDVTVVQNINLRNTGAQAGNADQTQTAIGNVTLAINPQGTKLMGAASTKNTNYPNSFNIRYYEAPINADGTVGAWAVTQITTLNNSALSYSNPSISVKSDGFPIILMDYNSGTSSNKIFANYYNGSSWLTTFVGGGVEVYVGNGYTQSFPSAVTDKDGVIGNVWHGRDATHTTTDYIRFSKTLDGGVNWSAIQKLVPGKNGTLTADKNNKYVITYEDVGVVKRIISTNKGDTWSAPATVGTGTNPSSLYDVTFAGEFGESAPTIYQDTQAGMVKYIGEYIINATPTVTLTNSSNIVISETSQIIIPRQTNFTIKFTGNDEDANDTIQYSIKVSGVTKLPLTPMNKLQEYQYTIQSSDLIYGQNSIDVIVQDSQGGIKTFNFKLNVNANIPIDSSCLANMKFNGYNKSTVSLAELVNHLT